MGLKKRFYLFLASMLVVIIVSSMALLVFLAREHVALEGDSRITELADLVAQDIVVANLTDDFARLEQRLQMYSKQSIIQEISWVNEGQAPLVVVSPSAINAPIWFVNLFQLKPYALSQEVQWFGKKYGTLRLAADNANTINNLWLLLYYWFWVLGAIIAIVVLGVELMTKPMINQIQQLAKSASHLGEGQLTYEIKPTGAAEVAQLAHSMEKMRQSLLASMQQQSEQQRTLRQVSDENTQRLAWLKNLLNTMPIAVLLEDTTGKVVFVNQLYCDFFGIVLSPKELVGYSSEQILLDTCLLYADPNKMIEQTKQLVALGSAKRQELFAMQDGRWLMRDFMPMRDELSDNSVGRLWLYQNMTEHHQLEQMLRWQATHDTLTGLVNRTEFEAQLEALPKDTIQIYALLYIDLDQFKLVNDTAGHIAGDELLKQVAQHIAGQIPKGALLARMGGDEFAILMIGDATQAMRTAESIRVMLAEFRFVYLDRYYQIGASIGVVPDIGAEQDAKMLMAMADAACYAAKNAGRNHVWLYQSSDAYLRSQQEEMRIVSALHEALSLNQFELYAQKLVPLQTSDQGSLHIEILLRWRNQQGEWISPSVFIAAAERYGLMHLIDRWVIEHTLTLLSQHPTLLERIDSCAINLSGASFSQPDLVDFVRNCIAKTGVSGNKLCFEITETAAVTQLSQAHDFMNEMKQLGCLFALDDFGSGQSSFRYLKQLPVDYLKIDGSFVQTMLDDVTNLALVRGMQEIAEALSIQTIAEFVESEEIATMLGNIGVNYAQGWHYHKAEPLLNLLT